MLISASERSKEISLGVWATVIPSLSDLSYLKLEVKRTIKSSRGDWENDEIKRWDGLKGELGDDGD